MNFGTIRVSYVTFASHQSPPRNSSNTKVPRSVVHALTNSSPNAVTNAKRCYVRVAWRVGAPSFIAIASNVRSAIRRSLIKLSSRRTGIVIVCLAINNSMPRSVLDVIAISWMVNITLWMRTAGTRNVSAVRYAGTYFNSRVSSKRTEKLNWFARVVFDKSLLLCVWFWECHPLFVRKIRRMHKPSNCMWFRGCHYCCCHCQPTEKLKKQRCIR